MGDVFFLITQQTRRYILMYFYKLFYKFIITNIIFIKYNKKLYIYIYISLYFSIYNMCMILLSYLYNNIYYYDSKDNKKYKIKEI